MVLYDDTLATMIQQFTKPRVTRRDHVRSQLFLSKSGVQMKFNKDLCMYISKVLAAYEST